MAYWRLFYHFVWTTKRRAPWLTPDLELRVHGYLRKQAEALGTRLFYINGMPDHVHVLAAVPPTISLSEFAKQLKGASSRFISTEFDRGFDWQDSYAVFSVSEQDAPRVLEYVKNQKQHHAQDTLVTEWERAADEDRMDRGIDR